MSIYAALVDLVGEVPSGYEPVAWVCCSLVLLFLVRSAFGIIASVLRLGGGG